MAHACKPNFSAISSHFRFLDFFRIFNYMTNLNFNASEFLLKFKISRSLWLEMYQNWSPNISKRLSNLNLLCDEGFNKKMPSHEKYPTMTFCTKVWPETVAMFSRWTSRSHIYVDQSWSIQWPLKSEQGLLYKQDWLVAD